MEKDFTNLVDPTVSVIIPTYNASTTIEYCLESLVNQNCPNIELILVDDKSTDDTIEKASKFPIKIIAKATNTGVAHSRNIGAENAVSDILVFVDSDIIVPFDGVLTITNSLIENPKAKIVKTHYSDKNQNINIVTDYKNLELFYRGITWGKIYNNTLAAFFFCIFKSTYMDVNGFSEDFTSSSVEDIEFSYRVCGDELSVFWNQKFFVDHLKCYSYKDMLLTDVKRVFNMMKIIKNSNGRCLPGSNSSNNTKFNVILSNLILVSFAFTFFKYNILLFTFILFFVYIIINLKFFNFLRKKRGFYFAIISIPLHFSEYMCAGVTILLSFILLSLPLGTSTLSNYNLKKKELSSLNVFQTQTNIKLVPIRLKLVKLLQYFKVLLYDR